MKILKPSYNSTTKVYTCELVDGFRLSVSKDDGVVSPPLDELTGSLLKDLIPIIIDSTKGWFSTPLTQEWLIKRVKFDIPIDPMSAPDFEGSVEYVASQLIISKEVFLFQCSVAQVKAAEKIVISFEDDKNSVKEEDLPISKEEVIGIGPTRRILQKEFVMKARIKAARALFNAERLSQEFLEEYGDTDWESEDSE